jgi:hypothetical protein
VILVFRRAWESTQGNRFWKFPLSFSTYWTETTGFQPVRFSESGDDLPSRNLKPAFGRYGFKFREGRS